MFVPIRGENTDAHRFIPQVFASGASATFSEEPLDAPAGDVVYVENTRAALQKVAERYRERFNIPVIGITGSVGKSTIKFSLLCLEIRSSHTGLARTAITEQTTTKELVALAVSAGLKTMKTAGNANSQIGLPMTVLRITPEDEAAIVEMGVSMPGEMARIAKVAKPNIAVMTNIGVSHIEFMKTRENIMKEKFGITDYLPNGSKVFVNGDDDLLSTLKSTPEKQIVRFGLGENCDWRAVELEADTEGTKFICVHDGKRVEMYVPAAGEHNVRNALAAVAVAVEVGVPEEKAVAAIRTYAPPAMRQQIKEAHGITLIDDTYNASPDSMRAALKILGGLKATGKKYAVLADMLELGDYAERGHYETGAFAAENGTDVLIGVGPLAKHIVEGFKNRENSAWFASNAEAIAYLKDRLHPGDAVLCKGSRGMHMDEIIHALSRIL